MQLRHTYRRFSVNYGMIIPQLRKSPQLWHCDAVPLRSGYNRAKDMPKMAELEAKIKKIIG